MSPNIQVLALLWPASPQGAGKLVTPGKSIQKEMIQEWMQMDTNTIPKEKGKVK